MLGQARKPSSRACLGSSDFTGAGRPPSSFRVPAEPIRDSPGSSVGGNRSRMRCANHDVAAISEKPRRKRGANEPGVMRHQRPRWPHQRERFSTTNRPGIRSFGASLRGLPASADPRSTPPTTCVSQRRGGLTNGRHHGRRRIDYPFEHEPQAVLPCMSWLVLDPSLSRHFVSRRATHIACSREIAVSASLTNRASSASVRMCGARAAISESSCAAKPYDCASS